MTAPQTVWIGGSYAAACGRVPAKRAPKKAGEPKVTIRTRMLQQVTTFPGTPTSLLVPEGVKVKAARKELMALSDLGLAHSVRRYERAGRLRGSTHVNYWYPGPAPTGSES